MPQPDSDLLKNPPHTERRKGTFYFRIRPNARLVKAGIVPGKDVRFSLRTKSRTVAATRAADELARHKRRESDLLAQLESGDLHEPAKSSKAPESQSSGSGKKVRPRLASPAPAQPLPETSRPLESLSASDRHQLILDLFRSLERQAAGRRAVGQAGSENDKAIVLENAKADLGHYQHLTLEQADGDSSYSWYEDVGAFLRSEGISFDAAKPDNAFVDLYRRAVMESEWRTLAILEGGAPGVWQDNLFRDERGLLAPSSSSQSGTLKTGKTIGDLCAAYPSRKGEGRGKKSSAKNEKRPLAILVHFFGEHHPLLEIGYEEGEEMIRYLARLPSKVDDLPPRQSPPSEDAAKTAIPPKRQIDLFRVFKATLNYAVDREWLGGNPWAGKTLSNLLPKPVKTPLIQWTGEELNAIFLSEKFRARKGESRDGQIVYTRYWVPLLVAFTGARPNEIASLTLGDVQQEGGILFIKIREQDASGAESKSLKTQASIRDIPIHSELLKMGFQEFVNAQDQSEPTRRLFPELTADSQTGSFAKNTAKTFITLARKLAGVTLERGQQGKDLKSFRHRAADCLREAELDLELRDRLLGHSEILKRNSGHHYGKGHSMEQLKKAVESIRYPGFDPSPLYAATTGDAD